MDLQKIVVNGAPPSKATIAAAGPFPWQQALISILGAALPILAKWILTALEPSSTPNNDQNTNPPA